MTQTVYFCEQGTGAPWSPAIINCGDPNQYIKILSASYGRTSTAVCPVDPANRPKVSTSFTQCLLDITYKVSAECNGHMKCDLDKYHSNDILGDPCVGVYKYTTVNYDCLEKKKPTPPEQKDPTPPTSACNFTNATLVNITISGCNLKITGDARIPELKTGQRVDTSLYDCISRGLDTACILGSKKAMRSLEFINAQDTANVLIESIPVVNKIDDIADFFIGGAINSICESFHLESSLIAMGLLLITVT